MVARRARFAVWWRRAGMGLRLVVLTLGLALVGVLVALQAQEPTGESSTSNLLVYLLVNLLVIVLCILVFLIARNVIRLILDRRRGILGAKLRTRLVLAFVGLALIPSTILFMLASGLLTNAMEGWFSTHVEGAVDGAVRVAKTHYASMKGIAEAKALDVTREVAAMRSELSLEARAEQLDEIRRRKALFSIRVVDRSGAPLQEAFAAVASVDVFSEPPLLQDAIARASRGVTYTVLEEQNAAQFVRTYTPLRAGRGRSEVVVTSLRIDPELTSALRDVNDSFREYEQLKLFRQPLRSGYLLTLAMITGFILFGAIWIGFYLAREITGPVQRLAEGMTSVAHGDFGVQVRASGDDELTLLIQSFNKMTRDLRSSRAELESRRRYIEAVVSNLAVGVVSIDGTERVSAVNDAALRLLSRDSTESVLGVIWSNLFPPMVCAEISELINGSNEYGWGSAREREVTLSVKGEERRVLCTVGRTAIEHVNDKSLVLLLDDVTELVRAQQMNAWREVARRIAHEIKNPLTPIQLSAQRLERLLAGRKDIHDAVTECTTTIVEHVDSIKRLANEFSRFARMPTAEFQPTNLNDLVADIVADFAAQHPDVVFQSIADSHLPEIPIDREQIRRALMNLIDNSVGALNEMAPRGEAKRVMVKTECDESRHVALIEVADNGPGVPLSDRSRIFEPYFTTKASGTGLGLAIVTTIINEHQGSVRVHDNVPKGARFVLEIPYQQRPTTQRRFAAA